jgi:hypothetical protein
VETQIVGSRPRVTSSIELAASSMGLLANNVLMASGLVCSLLGFLTTSVVTGKRHAGATNSLSVLHVLCSAVFSVKSDLYKQNSLAFGSFCPALNVSSLPVLHVLRSPVFSVKSDLYTNRIRWLLVHSSPLSMSAHCQYCMYCVAQCFL